MGPRICDLSDPSYELDIASAVFARNPCMHVNAGRSRRQRRIPVFDFEFSR